MVIIQVMITLEDCLAEEYLSAYRRHKTSRLDIVIVIMESSQAMLKFENTREDEFLQSFFSL